MTAFLDSPATGLAVGLIIGCLLAVSVFVSMRRENQSWKRQAIAAVGEALTALGHAAAARGDCIALAGDLDEALSLLQDAKLEAWNAHTATGLQAAQDQALALVSHTVDAQARILRGPWVPGQRDGA